MDGQSKTGITKQHGDSRNAAPRDGAALVGEYYYTSAVTITRETVELAGDELPTSYFISVYGGAVLRRHYASHRDKRPP